jgi:DNA polymerase-1
LQNIPAHLSQDFKHLDIRQMFIAQPGYKFVVADFSQIELRLMAHFSKDPMFLKAFRDWQCTACNSKGSDTKILHKCPKCGAAENEAILKDKSIPAFWHGLDLHTMTAEMVPALHGNRQSGKTANFALIYAAGATRMNMEAPEFSIGEWQDVIDDYFQTYSAVRHFHKYMEQVLNTSHETRDIFGRKRRIHPFVIKKSFKHALNQIINAPIQGSAAGIIQLASTKLRKIMIEKGYWQKEVIVVNSVHDETDTEVREDKLDEVIPMMKDCFENIVSLEVPIRVDIGVGANWKDAK